MDESVDLGKGGVVAVSYTHLNVPSHGYRRVRTVFSPWGRDLYSGLPSRVWRQGMSGFRHSQIASSTHGASPANCGGNVVA